MIFKIHDMKTKYPMEGFSFHAEPDALDSLFWDGENLEIVLVTGKVWLFDFDDRIWNHTETITLEDGPIG